VVFVEGPRGSAAETRGDFPLRFGCQGGGGTSGDFLESVHKKDVGTGQGRAGHKTGEVPARGGKKKRRRAGSFLMGRENLEVEKRWPHWVPAAKGGIEGSS